MDFSVIIFDTAPTGHTLRFLNFPDVLDQALTKIMEFKESMGGFTNVLNNVFSIYIYIYNIYIYIGNANSRCKY